MYSFLETAQKIKQAKKAQTPKQADQERQVQIVTTLAAMVDENISDVYFPPEYKNDAEHTIRFVNEFTDVLNVTNAGKTDYIWTVFKLIQAIFDEELMEGVDKSFRPNELSLLISLLVRQLDLKYGSRKQVSEVKNHPLVRLRDYLNGIATHPEHTNEKYDKVLKLMNAKLWLIYESIH